MNSRGLSRLLWLCVAVTLAAGLACAAGVLARRHRFEQNQNRVALVLDYTGVVKLARLTGQRPGDWLKLAWLWGYRHLGVEEDTLESLENDGHLELVRGAELMALRHLGTWTDQHPLLADRVYLVSANAGLLDRVEAGFHLRFSGSWQRFLVSTPQGFTRHVLEVPASLGDNVVRMGVGFGRDTLPPAVRRFGLFPRLNNTLLTPNMLAMKLKTLGVLPPRGCLIFSGVEALGYPGETRQAARQLARLPNGVCLAEQVEMDGLNEFKAAFSGGIRLHSISEEEMKKFSMSKFLLRYGRAARERGVRVLYVRPVTFAPKSDLIALNRRYLKGVVKTVRAEGMVVGRASRFDGFAVPVLWQVAALAALLALAGAAAALLLPLAWRPLGLAGVLAAAVVLAGGAPTVGVRLLLALVAVVAVGALPLVAAAQWLRSQLRPALWQIAFGFFVVSAASVAAGLLVSGAFASVEALKGALVFRGIKLALFAPLGLMILAWAWFEARDKEGGLPGFLQQPPARGELLAAAALALAAVLLVVRSGNETGAVGGWELSARDSLETLWGVRPRTKEFLIGHPALWLGLTLLARGQRGVFTWALLALAAAGQASVINTFCHLHTPVALSLERVLLGLGLGAVLGLGLSVAAWLVLDKKEKQVG